MATVVRSRFTTIQILLFQVEGDATRLIPAVDEHIAVRCVVLKRGRLRVPQSDTPLSFKTNLVLPIQLVHELAIETHAVVNPIPD